MAFKRKGRVQGSKARVLVASGQLIQPSTGAARGKPHQGIQPWQQDAWAYRNLIPELRFGTQFMAHAVSRATFFPAQVNHDGGDPIPFDSKECTLSERTKRVFQEEHERLPFAGGMGFTGRAIENLQVPAECYLHSFEEGGTEQWKIRSLSEVTRNPDGRSAVVQTDEGESREFSLDDEDLVRLWYPDPDKAWLPDSALRGLLDICEDVVLAGKEQRSAARSRIAANGLLLVPSGMVMLGGTDENGNPTRRDTSDSRFLNDFLAQFMAPIRNEGDPGAVAPVMLVGDAQDIDKVKHLTFVRETSADLGDKIVRGITRLATALDMPGEMITGLADANHWTAWQIDSATARYHIAPWCLVWCDSLTDGFLRPAGMARDITPDEAQQVQYHYDLGAITENPNRREDAKDAFDRGLISDEKAREDLGYDKGDEPTDKELARRIAVKAGILPEMAAKLLEVLMNDGAGFREVIEISQERADEQLQKDTDAQAQVAAEQAKAAGQGQLPPGKGGQDQTKATGPAKANAGPGGGTPNGGAPKPPAAHSGYNVPTGRDLNFVTVGGDSPNDWGVEVDVEACRALADLERSIRERLMQAGDDAIERAVERAGNRLRTKAKRSPELTALLDGVDADQVGAVLAGLPTAQLAGLDMQTQELLDGEFDALRPKWMKWVASAIDAVMASVRRILGAASADAAERARERMHARLGDGFDAYRGHLMTRAERRLWKPGQLDVPSRGEAPDTITTPEGVRQALSVVGGEDQRQGGLAAGQVVHDLMRQEGADDLGYEWAYGVLPRSPFPPHQRLHGRRFADWDSPVLASAGTGHEWVGTHFHPGDHQGCMCDYVYLWALAVLGPRADPQAEQERVVSEDNEARRNHRLLLESDRRAGRTRTTATATEAEREQIRARARATLDIEESA